MTLKEAEEIMHDWGKFLANSFAKINMLFAGSIPESFLPYPKEVLEEALDIMDKHYFDTNQKHNQNLIRETSVMLMIFKDDEEAVLEAAKHFNDPEWRKHFLPSFKEMQSEWLELDKTNPFKKID